ncbi:MAG: helix-turn-helix domain-containing protein [Gammaproteobacteria bacterium]
MAEGKKNARQPPRRFRQTPSYGFAMSQSPPPSAIFPERLRSARHLRELDQGELAKRAGMQASAISHFENGNRKPSFDNLRRLADALDVTTDYLLGRVNEPGGVGVADRLHRHIQRLGTNDREIAEDMIKLLATRARGRNRSEK